MQPSDQTKCPDCKMFVREIQFKQHIRTCSKFTGIAIKQIRKLPRQLKLLEFKFILAELEVASQQVKKQIAQKTKAQQPLNNYAHSNDYSYQNQIVTCKRCQKKMHSSYASDQIFYVEQCWHIFCKKCMNQYILDEFINQNDGLKCPYKNCSKTVGQYEIRILIGAQKLQQLESKQIRKMMNIVECVSCHSQYSFAAGNIRDAPAKDNNGKVLTEADKKNYAQNRFLCSKQNCKTQQCKQCRATPFHLGMTCKDFKARAQMKKCRYCTQPITAKNSLKTEYQALKQVCNSKQCQQLANSACTKMLTCGHACQGFRGEVKCLPCLHENCSKVNPDLNGQTGDDYCNVCFVEALTSAPCVKSECGHIFHEKCLKKRYQIRWLTPRILFNFCKCPLCQKWIQLSAQNNLAPKIKTNLDLFNKICTMSEERLKFQGCDKDEKVKDPKSPYFQKPKDYAMAIYAYFQCFKCKQPFFGGRKNCAQAMNQPQNAGSYDPKQLICPNCCDIPIQDCKKHGKEFIEFKCKFCCSTAQWFCWGNTHFCQPCHKRQCNGDYVSKYPKQKLPVCPGPSTCPIGGNHDGNGQERTLGCAICRNYKANSKNF